MKLLREVAQDHRYAEMLPAPKAPLRAASTSGRVSRAMLQAALVVLIPYDLKPEQLADALQTRFPSEHVHVDQVIRRLTQLEYTLVDDGHVGLTDEGMDAATKLRREEVRAAQATAGRPIQVAVQDRELLTRGSARGVASEADLREPALRQGAGEHDKHPSRIGDRLHYRDGRITDLQGRPVQSFTHQE